MGKDKEEKGEGLKSYILSFLFNSLCSIAIPVGLSFYFAPEKSWAYFQDTVQGKIDYVAGIEWQNIYDFVVSILEEVPPMLKTEYDVLVMITENVPPALQTTAYHAFYLDYRISLTLLLAIAIAGFFFPFQQTKDWLINVLWGSICVVSGFLPLDEGMDVIADKEAGMYKMTVILSAVALTLVANYLVVIVSWWIVAKILSAIWNTILSKIWRSKKSKQEEKVTDKKAKNSNNTKKAKENKKETQKNVVVVAAAAEDDGASEAQPGEVPVEDSPRVVDNIDTPVAVAE